MPKSYRPPMLDESGTLTVDDICEDLRLSSRVVREMLVTGVLPGFKVGRFWRVNQDDYLAWKRDRVKRAQRLARLGA